MNFIKNWVIPIVIGLFIALIIRTFLFTLVTVDGPSMNPNLDNGELVVESKISTVKRGNVIVFDATNEDPQIKSGHKDYVKRVIAVGGDIVSHKGANLYVNGKKVNQDYIGLEQQSGGTWGDWTLKTLSSRDFWQKKDRNTTVVPKNSYFVLGDHRSVSNDSRMFGYVEKKHVLGKIYAPFWNSDKQSKENVNDQSKKFFAN